jgi:pimeloyl-ACP methyl ester carboxylesterase
MNAVAQPVDGGTPAIRPFRINVPEAELAELRRRIKATVWPERETVPDATQGVQLATMQALARYWATQYDWRKVEARLNAVPNFITEIDGLDIHFIHVRSKHPNALPLIVTHGWPGSIVEQLKIIDPLVNPTAHGGSAADAFDVVIPSMPGYGYSGRPTTTGWGPAHIAQAWVTLMRRLGYQKFAAQGGDWGAVVTELMGVQAAEGLLGIHTNMPGVFPAEIDGAAFSGAPPPAGLSGDEKLAYERLQFVYQKGNRLRIPDGAATADAVRHRGFAHRSCGVFSGSRRAQPRADRTRLPRRERGPDARRRPRQHHDHLVDDEYGAVGRPSVLGVLGQALFQRQRRLDPGGGECIPRRALSRAAQLDAAGIPQTHPLQQAGERRPLRGLGAAETLHG